MATLLSVNVGLPKDVAWHDRTVFTGIWKRPVDGPQLVRRLNIDGDGQGDLAGHGGEQRAVLVYQIESYHYWQEFFGHDDFELGQYGENFTVDELSDEDVCIGDRYRIGEAEFEVTQPRVTCYRVGLRLGQPELPALLVAHHRPGFYLRVIREGRVRAGDNIERTRVGRHALSVAETDALLYLPARDPARLRAAVDIPALSPGWQQSFRELLDGAASGGSADGPAVGHEPGWAGFRPLRVAKVVAESPEVTSVYLTAEEGAALPVAMAGQYIALRAVGVGDPPPVRSYSLSTTPTADTYRISVKRESKGVVSTYLNSQLRPGAILDVAAPRGEFVLTQDDDPVLLISAGIGVTPVLAMLHQLVAESSQREVWWIHVTRDARQQAFADEAHRLLQSLPRTHERIFFTAAGPGSTIEGRTIRGRPTVATLTGLRLPVDATAYICGPTGFMTAMSEALTQIGLAPDRLHVERFGSLPAVNPGVVGVERPAPHQPPGPEGTGPLITFARQGLNVHWSERQGSLLELADACDLPTRWSCRTGVCHTCVTPVLSGRVSYSPTPLEMPGADEVLICCSRPESDLVLDL